MSLFALSACTTSLANPSKNHHSETVILLHGMIRTEKSMAHIAERLELEGYRVYNIDYPSRKKRIDQIADELHDKLKLCCHTNTAKLHFVTHSMGGIVARAYIAKYHPKNISRVVMLAPPNQGTELADKLQDNQLIGSVFGPALLELGTNKESVPNTLGEVDFELGIIIGNRSWNPITSLMIPGDDDGTVSIENTKLDSMTDFIILPHTHTFMMTKSAVIDEIIFFLEHGRFNLSNETNN